MLKIVYIISNMNIACIQKNTNLYDKIKAEFVDSQIVKYNVFSSVELIKKFDLAIIESNFIEQKHFNELANQNTQLLPSLIIVYKNVEEISLLIENANFINISFMHFDSITANKIDLILNSKKTPLKSIDSNKQTNDFLYDLNSLPELFSCFLNDDYDLKNHLEWISKFLNANKVFLLKKEVTDFVLFDAYSNKDEETCEIFIPIKSEVYSELSNSDNGFILIDKNIVTKTDKFLWSMNFEGSIFIRISDSEEYIILFSIERVLGKKPFHKDVFFIREFSKIFFSFQLKQSKKVIEHKKEEKNIKNDEYCLEKNYHNNYSNIYLKEMANRTSNDFKNALVSIKTFTQLFPDKYKDASFRKDFFKVITHEVNRLEGLMNTIGFFSSECILQCKTVLLSDIINSSYKMISDLYPDIKLKNECNNISLTLFCDDKLMVKAFQSLFINAAEAMNGSGVINVKMQTNEKKHFSFITIFIEDKGQGILDSNLSKLFEPFFSTKPNGLGLGLTMTKKIIDAHNGDISICNLKNDKGVSVKIIIPVTSRFLPISPINQISMSDN